MGNDDDRDEEDLVLAKDDRGEEELVLGKDDRDEEALSRDEWDEVVVEREGDVMGTVEDGMDKDEDFVCSIPSLLSFAKLLFVATARSDCNLFSKRWH